MVKIIMDLTIINKTLATITLFGHIGLGVFLFAFVLSSHLKIKISVYQKLMKLLRTNALLLGLLISLFATAMSLFYSEIAHIPPCSFCWYQRIFMFSQAVLFTIAYRKKDEQIANYSLALSGFGIFFAAYHILLQLGVSLATPCSLTASVSCLEKYFQYYGYITIPVMSLTAFLALMVLMGILKGKNKTSA